MDDAAVSVTRLLRQQAAIATFGTFALRQNNLMTILSEAARVCALGLGVPFSKVCRYRAEHNDLLIEAGYGWRAGVVGHVVSPADASSPQGRAFSSGQPSICNDVRADGIFELLPFYAEHGVVSTIDVIIKGTDRPYGVLEIDNDQQHDYDQHDIDFLTSFANVLAEAVATAERTETLKTTIEQMRMLVEEKDRLLDQKKVLAEELQHRVRNNLQLVYGMLSKQADETADRTSQRGIKAIARRVSTLAQVHEHLLGTEMTRTMDFGGYLKSLCFNLAEIQAAKPGTVTLTCETEPILLDLDVVTALGISITELVTNSYDHAFPRAIGRIGVSARIPDPAAQTATIVISDDGTGFAASPESKRHGVGLVRRLVEQVRGTADVDSSIGTVWTITVPVPPQPPAGVHARS